MSRFYYVAYCRYGVNMGDSVQTVYKFASFNLMREYLERFAYDDSTGQQVARRISQKTAKRILGAYNTARQMIKTDVYGWMVI